MSMPARVSVLLAAACGGVTGCGGGAATSATVTTTAVVTQAAAPQKQVKKSQTKAVKTAPKPKPKPAPRPATVPPSPAKPSITTRTTAKKKATTPSTPAPAPQPRQPAGVCPGVELGLRKGDTKSTYARIVAQQNVSCATASNVVSQWGQQQIGWDSALLPDGWTCTEQNFCRNGASSLSFVIVPPK